MENEWKDNKESYEVLDGRGLAGNFLSAVLAKAKKVAEGDGICVIQSFEPIPLYSTLEDLGFEHLAEKISDNEYRAYFYRKEVKEASGSMTMPLHPAALANIGKTDKTLGKIVSQFWQLVWKKEEPVPALARKWCWRRSPSSGDAGTCEGILRRSYCFRT